MAYDETHAEVFDECRLPASYQQTDIPYNTLHRVSEPEPAYNKNTVVSLALTLLLAILEH